MTAITARAGQYLELTKPRVVALIVFRPRNAPKIVAPTEIAACN